jgi:hypothetical protein
MATDLYYNPEALLAGPVAYGGGRGELLKARAKELEVNDRFAQEWANRQAMQEQSQAFQAQQDEQRLLMQGSLADQQIAAQLYGQEQDWQGRMALEQMNQQGQQDYAAMQGQAQAQAYQIQGAAQIARDMQQARMDKALTEHDAITKAWESGEVFTSDEQLQQAQAAWVEKYPDLGGWGLPDRIAQQQAEQVNEQRLDALAAMFTFPGEEQPSIGKEQMRAMLEGGAEMKDIIGLLPKMQQAVVAKAKAKESEANLQRDDVRQDQENAREAERAKQELAFEEQKNKQKLAFERQKVEIAKYNAAFKVWAAKKEALEAAGPEPKFDDFVKPMEDEAGDDGAPEWYKKLKPGEKYPHPDGTTRIKQ